jgi:5-methyltetrahydropteroyltriglutamate--homocysteine methyltransferase
MASDRILTTHAGSLPRPGELVELLSGQSRGTGVDEEGLAGMVDDAVAVALRRQHDAGVDIANDGEQGRESFFTYVQHRMSGFGPGDRAARHWRDLADFPDLAAQLRARHSGGGPMVTLARPPQAVSEVRSGPTTAVDADCARLSAGASDFEFTDLFMTAPSPGIIVTAMANRHYPDDDEYLGAVGVALATEYRRISDAGLLLQIDAPDLAMEHHGYFADRPLDDFIRFVDAVIATINRALEGIPPERVRLHVCWGNYDGPHTHDVPLGELLPSLYQASVGGLLLSGANPRHEHDYREFTRQPLPTGWTISAGVIDTTTNYVEHPEVVADRLERIATAVGDPRRVVASTDCGFDTSAGFRDVAPDVAWAKLVAMSEGAALATDRLF